jgi:TonB family protein
MVSPIPDNSLPDPSGATAESRDGQAVVAGIQFDATRLAAPPAHHSRPAMLASLAFATLLHGAVGLALISGHTEQHGAEGSDLEAISVEVVAVPARALESRTASASQDAAKSASIDQVEGAAEASSPAKAAAPAEHEPRREPEKAREIPDPKPDQAEAPPETPAEKLPLLALTKPDPTAPDPDAVTLPLRENTPPKPKAQTPDVAPAEPHPAAAPGGDPTRAAEGTDRPAPTAARASPGAIRAFTRSVVDALAHTRPKGSRGSARGTAKVVFALAEGGGLEFVRVASSSGHVDLDEAALAAVKRASFPAPPTGMALVDRTFEVPYHFR